ncbi:MAG TPA: aminotransferase class III-fold pyridoxal phosphate-dependent enzyme [Acidimicrobiia bacterium]|nr:aminotransferase class III-fold pyridoxal phosphate-dependent enzyme [Acidimicrobiia bacterium]
MNRFEQSDRWWGRSQRVIPLGTQTFSKSPTQFVQGASPIYLARGRGARVWDVDGNEYLDYPMALGPVILGYAEPMVDDAIVAQLHDGITFTLMHPLEVEVAERIVAMCPGVEAVRFAKSGSDAVSGAVRAARALTGRDAVLAGGYHGWHDWYIGTTTRAAGVPGAVRELTHAFPFGDLDALAAAFDAFGAPVAAVVIEPAGATVPEPGYLQGVVDLAHERGALAIFDEVITGFRLAPGGARERYGVLPDFSCYGKALGNGMPVAAVAGAWSTMAVFEEIFFSGTHGGEALSLAAARAVLDTVADGTVLRAIEARGRRLLDGFEKAVAARGVGDLVTVGGEPQRTVVGFPSDDALVVRSWVQQRFAQAKILFNGSMFICARHTDADIDDTIAVFDDALAVVASGEDLRSRLVGDPVEPVFRKP